MTFLGSLKRAFKSDAWQNAVTLLGTSYDKQVHHRIYPEIWYDCEDLENLYIADSYARRIVAEPVHAAFRNGFDLTYGGNLDAETVEDSRQDIGDLLAELKAEKALETALIWGRLYGRGGLLLGVDDGLAMDEPFDPERVREGSFRWLDPLTCEEFDAVEYYDDPEEPNYGDPKIWRVQRVSSGQTETVLVHESRILLTRGVEVPRQKRVDNDWRDASVLQSCYSKIRSWDSANQGAAHMLLDASQAVLKIQDFVKLLADNELSVFTNRMRIMELARSLRILPIDAEREGFEYVERSFQGVADLIDRAAQDLAGAAGMPQTLLLGRSPAGMNATGESDIRGWYDQVHAERSSRYQPLLESLVYYAALSTRADAPDTWGISWNPLWQETAKEKAERGKIVGETDQIYYNMGAVTEDEIADTRFGGEEFNDGVIQIDLEGRAALKAMDLERARGELAEEGPDEETP